MHDNFVIKLLLSQNWGVCVYTKIWEEELQELESSQDRVIKESIVQRSVSADLNVVLESALYR